MTRRQRAYIDAVSWVIGAARRVTESPRDDAAMSSLRCAIERFDWVAKLDDPKPPTPRLVCPDGGGRCTPKSCEIAEGCPGPVPNPARGEG